MEVRFYHFTKRNKSTKIPTSGDYLTVNVSLKDGCSVLRPVLLLQTFNAAAYNYFYVPSWNRYYFIADANFVNYMWEVGGTIDVLASYKAAIGNTTSLILYASGANADICDDRIPSFSTVVRGHEKAFFTGMTISTVGRIVLGITGKGSFGIYVLKNASDLNELLDGVDNWTSAYWNDIFDAAKQLYFGGSAAECLKAAIKIPIQFDASLHGTEEELVLGGYPCQKSDSTKIKGYKIGDPIYEYVTTISIPWNYNDWRNISQYTEVALYIPFIGVISLPATELKLESSLRIDFKLNISSGDIAVAVVGAASPNRIYCTASGNCAINTPYGSTGIDTNRATAAITSGVGVLVAAGAAAFTGGLSLMAAGAIGAGLASVAKNTLAALGGNSSGSGGLGGGASSKLEKNVHIWVVSKQLTESQSNLNPLIGKPLMKCDIPSKYLGYVQTDGFQFEHIQAYSEEKDMINRLMDSGIYYE